MGKITLDKMVGQRFGRLTLKKYLGDSKFLCQCDCGNEKIAYAKRLRSGVTKSCGCLILEENKKVREEKFIGQKFGRLTVLEEDTERTKFNEIKFKCQCDCGAIVSVKLNSLISGHTQSCGCLHSAGEEEIAKILTINNIIFKREQTFQDCCFLDKHNLRFDFAIYNTNNDLLYLIEYDGPQHFGITKQLTWFNEENYQKIKERDNFKNNYCKTHNIPLIRIPYTQLRKITIDDLMLEKSRYIIC